VCSSDLGRILRDERGHVVAVREQRDASETERAIDEVNPGMYAVETEFLRQALASLSPDNDQGELYLTDIIALAAERAPVASYEADAATLGGINDRAQLAEAETAMHERIATAWRHAGATIRSSARIDADVRIDADACIEHGVVLRGASHIQAGARIDVGCVLNDVVVEVGAHLKPYSVCTDSRIGPDAQVGPLAHLRPGTELGRDAKIGNFVETKKVRLGVGAKANHLSYLGDGEVGDGANIGAGTIFCNYDGFQKHRTVIGAGAFIGSDSQLVAPVTIGEGAYVATGTTVTRDVPANGLAIARTRQENKEGYASRLRGRLKAAKAAKAAKAIEDGND
jgi:bifunctional UDP-N-acetylglucosamine pyrophosphorylase/glucosamine-1-phosphate N-acetyltransferase